MPKLSYAQEIAALEETLAALHASAHVVPPLALAVGEELAAQIAEIKRLKERQRFYAAEAMVATEALQVVIARGKGTACSIRACAVFLYGAKSARLKQFGIRIHRRPRRKVTDPAEVVTEASGALRDAAWTAHAARANVDAVGGEALEGRAEADRDGGNGAESGGKAQDVWAEAPAAGAFVDGARAKAFDDRGNAQSVGANVTAIRGAAARAA